MVFTFVALLLTRFDVGLDASGCGQKGGDKPVVSVQSFPRVDATKPGLGALGPVHGDDVILVLRPSKSDIVHDSHHGKLGGA